MKKELQQFQDVYKRQAYGVVVNSPIPNEDIKAISEFVDIPVIATVTGFKDDVLGKIEAGAEILNVSGGPKTPELVAEIRKLIGDKFPIIATGGSKSESIKKTIDAGANAISYTCLLYTSKLIL